MGNPVPEQGSLWGRPVGVPGSPRRRPLLPSPLLPSPLLSSCSIAAGRLSDGFTFVVYEFWETEEEWKR